MADQTLEKLAKNLAAGSQQNLGNSHRLKNRLFLLPQVLNDCTPSLHSLKSCSIFTEGLGHKKIALGA